MKILFNTGMTFQFRSLLPIMKLLIEKGVHDVYVLRKGYFSERRIRNKPRSFSDVTKSSLMFIAQQIGIEHDFLEKVHFVPSSNRLRFPPRYYYYNYDMFISTTKGFQWLNQMAKFGKPRIAIGYQNFLGTYYTKGNNHFPDKSPPDLDFEQRMRQQIKVEYQETGLPFLDSYVICYGRARKLGVNKILLLHPGGYRKIITRMGEKKLESFRKQINFYKRILNCIPSGMNLTVKIHPLAAKYHDKKAHMDFIKELNIEIVEGFLGDIVFDYDVVLSVGSSALFEILPFDRRLFVLGFFSPERTKYYSEMPSLFVNSETELYKKLNNDMVFLYKTEFEKKFIERLVKTTDGCATKRVMELIDNYC